MAVSLVLNQWFLLTLDYRHDMRKPSQRYLFLCGGFDVCADKTCQNKPVPYWQVLAQQHAVVGELAARDLLELLEQVATVSDFFSSPATS